MKQITNRILILTMMGLMWALQSMAQESQMVITAYVTSWTRCQTLT